MSNGHKLVQVNASAKNQASASNSDFSVDFQTTDMDKVIQVSMVKASLPRMFPNIWSVNNTIDIIHSGADNYYTIPPLQYDINTLITALNTATAPIFVTWALNATTNKLTATYSSVTTVTLSASKSSIGPYIGLTADVTLGAPSDMPSYPQLSGPTEIFIQSNLIAANNCVTGSSSLGTNSPVSIPLVSSISFIDVPWGFVGRFDGKSLEIGYLDFPSEIIMRRIDVRLTDVYNNVIQLPDNCFLDMVLQFTKVGFV